MRRWLWVSVFVVLILITAACGTQNGRDEGEQGRQEADSSVEANGFPLTVVDAAGEPLVLEQPPERIASTSPAETEVLFALGLGDKIVGVSDFCNYPEEALSKPKLGGIVAPNVEAVLAAEADLVIGGISMDLESAEHLRELGVPLYVSRANSIDEVLDAIMEIGRMTGHVEEAVQLTGQMKADIALVSEAVADLSEEERKRVYVEFSPGWTVGRGEYIHELIELSGAINIAEEMEGWAQINEEKVIMDNPDVIFYADDLVLDEDGTMLEDVIRNRSGWSAIDAVANGDMYGINNDVLARPGPRLTDALLDMARAIYPDRLP